MNRFLNIFGAFGAATIMATIVTGYYVADRGELGRHVIFGLISALGAIMGLIIVLFYFIATGAIIRKMVESGLMSVESYNRTREFKKNLFPWIVSSIALLMITPVLGAAYDAGKAPVIYHALLAWSSIAMYIFTIMKARGAMIENKPIFHEAVIKTAQEEHNHKTDG